jgi:hypothetical protein
MAFLSLQREEQYSLKTLYRYDKDHITPHIRVMNSTDMLCFISVTKFSYHRNKTLTHV